MYTHACAHENTCACMTQSARWSTATKTNNLCTNMHTHTHTHVNKRIDVQIHTHMHIYTYIMSAHIWCERCLLITESPKTPGHYRYLIWVLDSRYTHTHIYTHPYKMYIWTHAKHVWIDGAAATARAAQLDTKKLCPSPSTPSRPHPLICTGAEPIHPVHCPRQLPSFSCHFGGVTYNIKSLQILFLYDKIGFNLH